MVAGSHLNRTEAPYLKGELMKFPKKIAEGKYREGYCIYQNGLLVAIFNHWARDMAEDYAKSLKGRVEVQIRTYTLGKKS